MKKKANLLFWILMFISIALASFSLIIDHVGVSISNHPGRQTQCIILFI